MTRVANQCPNVKHAQGGGYNETARQGFKHISECCPDWLFEVPAHAAGPASGPVAVARPGRLQQVRRRSHRGGPDRGTRGEGLDSAVVRNRADVDTDDHIMKAS